MPEAYIVRENGKTDALKRVLCKNEDLELQLILEMNHDLLPGGQINPEAPRRWLLIKREMPVPDPNTGLDRWSIDFLFGDQDAIPTFVECKRFNDTRSRREVIGQMFEYAANGQYYWSKEDFRRYAALSAAKSGSTLEKCFDNLIADRFDSVDDYFECMQNNLQEGQVRIVFYLEKAPRELLSLVDYLNKQMERSEILLVEAKQFTDGKQTLIFPTLFGYTEEARQVKKTVTVTRATGQKKWDESTFFEEARARLGDSDYMAVKTIYTKFVEYGMNISWGLGAKDGSFKVGDRSLGKVCILYVYTNGNMDISYGYLNESVALTDLSEKLKLTSKELLALEIPDGPDRKRTTVPISAWGMKANQFADKICSMVAELRSETGE